MSDAATGLRLRACSRVLGTCSHGVCINSRGLLLQPCKTLTAWHLYTRERCCCTSTCHKTLNKPSVCSLRRRTQSTIHNRQTCTSHTSGCCRPCNGYAPHLAKRWGFTPRSRRGSHRHTYPSKPPDTSCSSPLAVVAGARHDTVLLWACGPSTLCDAVSMCHSRT